MDPLEQIIRDYATLEQQVQQHMNTVCSRYCSMCQNCCCRYDICEESLDSAFLCEVRKYYPASTVLSDSYGWLTATGCALQAGRPPVCYEFICDSIMSALPNDPIRYALRVSGMLLTYLGTHAVGKTHLVEILNPAQLTRINRTRFSARLHTAQTALTDLLPILNESASTPTESMQAICPPDTEMYQGF